MQPIIQDSILGSDLDCRFYDLLNVKALVPIPANLVTVDHPALSDERPPVPGSVTNESVAGDAAIVQSKLSLDGQIPTAWLGVSSSTAAQGDLAEYLSNKNQPGGYCGLDASGKVPSAQLPGTTGTGTVTSVGLTMPSQFSISGSPVTAAGTIAVTWASVADLSWFGNKSGASAPPQFYTSALPPELIPSLDASKVTTGTLNPLRLPTAVGVGVTNSAGAVPAPGTTGATTDYLGRDMTYHSLPTTTDPTYEPILNSPTLTRSFETVDPKSVLIDILGPDGVSIADEHTVFFYSLISDTTGFKEFPSTHFVDVVLGDPIWAYAAHAGYKNSAIVTITV